MAQYVDNHKIASLELLEKFDKSRSDLVHQAWDFKT